MPIVNGQTTIADVARDLEPHAPICFYCREPVATADHQVDECKRMYSVRFWDEAKD